MALVKLPAHLSAVGVGSGSYLLLQLINGQAAVVTELDVEVALLLGLDLGEDGGMMCKTNAKEGRNRDVSNREYHQLFVCV